MNLAPCWLWNTHVWEILKSNINVKELPWRRCLCFLVKVSRPLNTYTVWVRVGSIGISNRLTSLLSHESLLELRLVILDLQKKTLALSPDVEQWDTWHQKSTVE